MSYDAQLAIDRPEHAEAHDIKNMNKLLVSSSSTNQVVTEAPCSLQTNVSSVHF